MATKDVVIEILETVSLEQVEGKRNRESAHPNREKYVNAVEVKVSLASRGIW